MTHLERARHIIVGMRGMFGMGPWNESLIRALAAEFYLVEQEGMLEHLQRIEDKLTDLVSVVDAMRREERTMGTAIVKSLDDVLADVAAETTADDSLITLVQGLAQQLTAALAAGDTAKIQQIATALETETAKVVAAVKANTPAAPPAP